MSNTGHTDPSPLSDEEIKDVEEARNSTDWEERSLEQLLEELKAQ